MAGLVNKLFGMADDIVDGLMPHKAISPRSGARRGLFDVYGEPTEMPQKPSMFVSPGKAMAAGVIDETPEDMKMAQELFDMGANTDTIAKNTGMHMDAREGTMHAWLDDFDATVRPDELNIGLMSGSYKTKMGKLLDHDELYKYDPSLKDYSVEFADLGDSVAADHNAFNKTIRINTNPIVQKFRGHQFTPDGIKVSLIHELQHAVDNARVDEGYSIIERALETGSNMSDATRSAVAEVKGLQFKNLSAEDAKRMYSDDMAMAKVGMSHVASAIQDDTGLQSLVKKNFPANSTVESMKLFMRQLGDYPLLVDKKARALELAKKGDPLRRNYNNAAAEVIQEQMDRLEVIRARMLKLDPGLDEFLQRMYAVREMGRRASKNYLNNTGEFRARLSGQLSTEGRIPGALRDKNYLKQGYDHETEAIESALSPSEDQMSSRLITRGKRKPTVRDPFQGQDDDPFASTVG